ncbi:MAG TPA: alpha/beta fold hydrolase [Candidatus Eisenbacteria bacterium]|nr:alpha/beta fold hydrolase [Candidatus Eisenbacteria bacterium]
MQHIILKTPDGFELDANYYAGTNGISIVFCHGLAVGKEREDAFFASIEMLHNKGFSLLLFDFRANGKSTGDSVKDFSVSGQQIDIDTAIAYVKDQGNTTIYLAGASFGGAAVTLYATKHIDNIQKLLLLNPSLDYDRSISKHFLPGIEALNKEGFVEIGSRNYRLGKKLYEEMKTMAPYKELEKWQKDLLIIHGDNDALVPHPLTVEIFEKLSNPKKKFSLILGADHGFHEEPYTTQAAEKIVEFFST